MHQELARVEQMLDARASFAEIETYIEENDELPDEAKSALWLLAWVEIDRRERRRAVGELLIGVAHKLG
jgi:hypothetical protein